MKIKLIGPNGTEIISGKSLREKLRLLSTKFEVDFKFSTKQSNEKNSYNDKINLGYDNKIVNVLSPHPVPLIPKDYFLLVRGYGFGHGVGMSQWGAKAMAERGSSFRSILKHYYTGVKIKTY